MDKGLKDITTFVRRRRAAMREIAGPHLDRLDAEKNVQDFLEELRIKDPAAAAAVGAYVAGDYRNLEDEQRQRGVAASQVMERDRSGHPLKDIDSGVPDKIKTFDTFLPRDQFPSVVAARQTVQEWTHGHGTPMVILAGVPGTGKTHLLQAAGGYIEAHYLDLIFRTEADLIGDAQRRFEDKTSERFLRAVCGCYWLILDDLGAAALGVWGQGTMDRIVDARYRLAQQGEGRTLIATNLTAMEMPARMASRLQDPGVCQVVKIMASDYRINGGDGAQFP
jgi:DNA replication protein DnaC